MRHIRQWPCIRGAPAFGARKNVTETRSRQDTGILSLEPVVEPCERLDMQAFPRPRQTMLAQHGDLNVLAVGEFSGMPERWMEDAKVRSASRSRDRLAPLPGPTEAKCCDRPTTRPARDAP